MCLVTSAPHTGQFCLRCEPHARHGGRYSQAHIESLPELASAFGHVHPAWKQHAAQYLRIPASALFIALAPALPCTAHPGNTALVLPTPPCQASGCATASTPSLVLKTCIQVEGWQASKVS